ncbi:hypothetical protein KUL97_09430, partial [Synechococcus sp. HK05]|uniref:hypothetical protein n=1 Tax=Synechococcus sp. HK05 TaxID=2725975 RepID=UPI001C37EEA2
MAKKYRFTILGDVTNASSVTEVGYNYNFKGRTLGQGSVGSNGDFSLSFKSNKKNVRGEIEFEKLNSAGSGNFVSNSLEYSLTSNESQAFKAKSKKSPQIFTYSFSLSNPVNPLPPPNPEASRITLTTFQDIYSTTQGGQVIGGTFTPNNERFTTGQDIVEAAAGTLGQDDTLTDTSSNDNDELRLTTTANSSLLRSLADVQAVSGIENFYATASNDTSTVANFSKFSGLKSITISGSFTARTRYSNLLNSGARTIDFSGVTGPGVLATPDNGEFANEPLVVTGSTGSDNLAASLGTATIRAGSGDDTITGSSQSSGFYAGELNNDTINLLANNQQDTVSLVGITSAANGDTITGFTGAQGVANGFDLLQFDAASFSNYTAGSTINLIDRQEAISRRGNAAALQNTVFFVNNAQDL